METTNCALEDCLRLLRGERDEHRLAGLLLATKFCQGDDRHSILRVYHAVGPRFLSRLLKTGMVEGGGGGKGGEEREAYLRLSVTVLSAFCRVPEIAGSEDMIAKVPLVLDIISKTSDPVIYEECYEILLLVSTTTKGGLKRLYESDVINVLASRFSTFPDGARSMGLTMRLLQLLTTQLPLDLIIIKHSSQISCMVQAIARQFGVLQTGLKIDALHLLTTILSSDSIVALQDLKSRTNEIWATYIHVGVLTILQNRVASSEKLQALALVDSMMTLVGEKWLLDHNHLPGEQDPMPVDKCLLLVLESSRIEVAVLLNEIAYLKYEVIASSSSLPETFTLKQRNLAVSFSLIEKLIKLIACDNEAKGDLLSESTIMKAIEGLNETTSLVLDFLRDAKDHGQRKGDHLLASVRLLGSYLAEVPFACKEKVQDLLRYILSIEGEEEESPFYSVCFMLPMLCQTTMEVEGCKVLVSFGGHKIVANCLVEVIGPVEHMVEDNGTAFLACDTILNLLLNRREVQAKLDDSCLVPLLRALAIWAGKNSVPSIVMIASSICSLIFDLTSEESLMKSTNFDQDALQSLAELIARSWDASEQVEASTNIRENLDLHLLVLEGYGRWRDRFPHVRGVVEGSRFV